MRQQLSGTSATPVVDVDALFITFAETLRAYPGGLRGLAEAAGLSYWCLRRIRDTAFGREPREYLRRLASAAQWNDVAGMRGLAEPSRRRRLVWLYRRARRYPECGHTVCSQNYIDTGNTACIERSSRQLGLLVPGYCSAINTSSLAQ